MFFHSGISYYSAIACTFLVSDDAFFDEDAGLEVFLGCYGENGFNLLPLLVLHLFFMRKVHQQRLEIAYDINQG
ncbi:MAG: hypothetical protein Q8K70_08030 [Bacteroidota bacterium]|nr:hypothetical protein [Bacteroidota bacterium]